MVVAGQNKEKTDDLWEEEMLKPNLLCCHHAMLFMYLTHSGDDLE